MKWVLVAVADLCHCQDVSPTTKTYCLEANLISALLDKPKKTYSTLYFIIISI